MNYIDRNRLYWLVSNSKLVVLLLFLIVFLFKLPIINMPYYWDGLGTVCGALWIYQHGLIPVLGPHDFGHPPLVPEILVMIWSIFGYSIWVSHLVIIIFSFVGIYFTYRLGMELKNKRTGVIAALFLFFSPLYFAQSGILNLAIPLTAFIVTTTYFAIKENTKLYIICGICLVMTKAPGLLLILSILVYIFFKNYRKPKKILVKKLLIYSIPFIFFLSWIIYHKWTAGWFLYPRAFVYRIEEIALPLYQRMKTLFLDDYRFFISACMISYIFLTKRSNSKKMLYSFLLIGLLAFLIKILFLKQNTFYLFLLLFAMFTIRIIYRKRKFLPLFLFMFLCLIAFSSCVRFLPRYLLIVYPFYYIIGSYCLVEIFENRHRILIGMTVILLFLLTSNWYCHRLIEFSGRGPKLESNLEYLDLIKTHKLASKFIEENYPQSIVLTSWPQIEELGNPFLGYVTTPIKCVYFLDIKEGLDPKIDLIYYSDQSHKPFEMQELMDNLNIRLLKSFKCNGKSTAIYKIIKN